MRHRSLLLVVLLSLSIMPGISRASSRSEDLASQLATHAAARASAVSGPVISISPSSHDFGRVNAGTFAGGFDFTIQNIGDADLHITGAVESHPGTGFAATTPGTIAPGDIGLMTVTWTSTGSGSVTDNFTVQSDASFGSNVILAYGTANNPPQFSPPLQASYVANAFVPFSLTADAIDPEGDFPDWSLASVPPLPVGAAFDHTNGALTWTPDPGDAGSYAVTITVTDGVASTAGPFTLEVRALNRPPVANPGGPYSGFTGLPMQLNGTASSDPDEGQTLTYEWDLGDATSATGPSPVHTYSHPGIYVVNLTVTDSDVLHLQNVAATIAEVLDYFEAKIVQSITSTNVIRTSGNGVQQFGLWMLLRPVTDVDVSTIRMSTTFPNAGTVPDIKIADKRPKIGDIDADQFSDLDFSFRSSDLRALLAYVPDGERITLLVLARALSDGAHIRGTIDVVKDGTTKKTSIAAPNPLRPESSISYSAERGGFVSVRIFSAAGRLVRSFSEQPAGAGTYQVHWNGHDEDGRPVPSGIYFIRVEQNGESTIRKLTVLR
jgi:PKD repeat protein